MTHTETKQIEGGDLGPPGVLITFSCYTFTPQQRRRRLGLNDNTFPVIPSHIPRRSLSLWYLLLCVALSICSSSGTLYISLALGTSQAVFLIFINCFDKSGKNLHIKDNRDRIGQGPNIYQAQHLYNGNCSKSNLIAAILAECTNRVWS